MIVYRRGKSALLMNTGNQQKEEKDTSIERRKKVSKSMQRYSTPELEDSPKKKFKRRSSLSFKRRRSASLSWLEGKDCKFFWEVESFNGL